MLLRFSRLDLGALTGRDLTSSLAGRAAGERQHRHAASGRRRDGAGAHPEPASASGPSTASSPAAEAATASSRWTRPTPSGRAPSAAGGGSLGWAAPHTRRDGVHPGGGQPHRLRLAAPRRHRAAARHLARPGAARRRGAGRGAAERQPRHARGRRASSSRRALEFQQARSPLAQPASSPGSAGRRPQLTASVGRRLDRGRGLELHPQRPSRSRGYADSLGWSLGSSVRQRGPGGRAPDDGGSATAPTWSGSTVSASRCRRTPTVWIEPALLALTGSSPSVSPVDVGRARRLGPRAGGGHGPFGDAGRHDARGHRARPGRPLRPAPARHDRRGR